MICLTFDIEERFHSHLVPPDAKRHWTLEDCVSRLIDRLLEEDKAATFFVVGELAEKFPGLIRRMSDEGFEVASHSHSHPRFDRNEPEANVKDLARSKTTLEDVTGRPIRGFRAPSWTARLEDHWLWEYLVEEGFLYDSSLFPFRTHLYGSRDNPTKPFQLRPGLLEVPPAVFQLSRVRIPYGGGFYLRLYPWWLTRALLTRDMARGVTPVVYLHPWELEAGSEVLERGWRNRFIGNYNIGRTWGRLNSLLAMHETTTLQKHCEALRGASVGDAGDVDPRAVVEGEGGRGGRSRDGA